MGEVMTMREKMAKAICRSHFPMISDDAMSGRAARWIEGRMVEIDSAVWEDYLPDADAALAAMEEPTEAMVDAGTRAYDEGDGEYGIFCAMIRKAKEE